MARSHSQELCAAAGGEVLAGPASVATTAHNSALHITPSHRGLRSPRHTPRLGRPSRSVSSASSILRTSCASSSTQPPTRSRTTLSSGSATGPASTGSSPCWPSAPCMPSAPGTSFEPTARCPKSSPCTSYSHQSSAIWLSSAPSSAARSSLPRPPLPSAGGPAQASSAGAPIGRPRRDPIGRPQPDPIGCLHSDPLARLVTGRHRRPAVHRRSLPIEVMDLQHAESRRRQPGGAQLFEARIAAGRAQDRGHARAALARRAGTEAAIAGEHVAHILLGCRRVRGGVGL